MVVDSNGGTSGGGDYGGLDWAWRRRKKDVGDWLRD
jgi:hypothetical protein